MSALTRGPLPARVYWTRRLLVLGTVFLLVFGIARVLTSGSDGSSAEEPQAVQAAGTPTDSADSPARMRASAACASGLVGLWTKPKRI
mgnify:CR=1 FL=1